MLADRLRAMPFLVMVVLTAVYGVVQGETPSWVAKEFNTGFGQTMAAAGLAVIAGAMLARLASRSGASRWWRDHLGGRGQIAVTAAFAAAAGIGGTPIGALAAMAPVIELAGPLRRRAALVAGFVINAVHGSMVPSPLPIAALAILGGEWRWGLAFGLPVAVVQIAVGLVLAGRAPAAAPVALEEPVTPPRGRATLAVLLAVAATLGLLLCQSLGQIPSEPLGGGQIRETLLGLGRPMIVLWVGLGLAVMLAGGVGSRVFAEDGWAGQGARAALGVLLAVGAAGGFQMMLHNNGMAEILSERLLGLDPALGVAIPFVVALVNRALQGSPLTAAIAAAGMMQPLLVPLGLDGEAGRALVAVAVGAGCMAMPHINDGYFWLAAHLADLGVTRGLRRVTGGAIAQAAAALAVLVVLAHMI